MGDDISSGLLSMAVCFDFCSTNLVQLSNGNPYCYQFRCHHSLITQLSAGYNASQKQIVFPGISFFTQGKGRWNSFFSLIFWTIADVSFLWHLATLGLVSALHLLVFIKKRLFFWTKQKGCQVQKSFFYYSDNYILWKKALNN